MGLAGGGRDLVRAEHQSRRGEKGRAGEIFGIKTADENIAPLGLGKFSRGVTFYKHRIIIGRLL